MTITEFKKFVENHSTNKDDFFKMTALCGEIGELANVIKKAEFFNMFPDSYAIKVEDEISKGLRKTWREQFIDESGDVFFYFIQLLNHWSVDIEEVIEYQINKVETKDKELGRAFKK